MKYILATILVFNLNAFGSELCNDKGRLDTNGHVHYIYPKLIDSQLKLPTEDIDLTRTKSNVNMKVKLELVNFDNFPGGMQVVQDLDLAKNRLQEILVSNTFMDKVYEHQYKKKLQFKWNNKKTNQQIYETILDGADKYNTNIDNEIDMILCPYYSSKKVIGYTYSNRKEVWVNFKYYRDKYNDFQVSDMVGNILHEWLHNANFSHSRRNNSTRKYTVPYGVGYIARDIARIMD